MKTPRNDLDREPFGFDNIIQFAKDTAEQVKLYDGREIPVTSNADVRPSLIPYDFNEKGIASIEARGVDGWPIIHFNKESGVIVHAMENCRYTKLHSQTGALYEVDLDEAKRHFVNAINERLKFGCEENPAEIDPSEINRKDPTDYIY